MVLSCAVVLICVVIGIVLVVLIVICVVIEIVLVVLIVVVCYWCCVGSGVRNVLV